MFVKLYHWRLIENRFLHLSLNEAKLLDPSFQEGMFFDKFIFILLQLLKLFCFLNERLFTFYLIKMRFIRSTHFYQHKQEGRKYQNVYGFEARIILINFSTRQSNKGDNLGYCWGRVSLEHNSFIIFLKICFFLSERSISTELKQIQVFIS